MWIVCEYLFEQKGNKGKCIEGEIELFCSWMYENVWSNFLIVVCFGIMFTKHNELFYMKFLQEKQDEKHWKYTFCGCYSK